MDNKGFASRLFLVVAVLLMAVVLTVFLVRGRGAETTAVAEFYNRYLRDGEINEEIMTEELLTLVRERGASSFLCVEVIPDGIIIERIEKEEGAFRVYASHLNNPIRVIVDDKGKMASIECPLLEIEEVAEQVPLTEEITEDEGGPANPFDIPQVLRAKNDLAFRLGIDSSQIKLKSVEAVIFSDSTLGMSAPGEIYNQKITPGYLIILSVNQKNYRYHADGTKTIFVP